jgi:hypothetical protein
MRFQVYIFTAMPVWGPFAHIKDEHHAKRFIKKQSFVPKYTHIYCALIGPKWSRNIHTYTAL